MLNVDLKKLSIALSLVALGLVIGSIVSFLKLPVYLDTIGVMLATLLLGWRWGVFCSFVNSGIAFFIVSPYIPAYTGTMLGLVLFTEICRKYNLYSSIPRSIFSGLIHGIVGTVLSAPVTYFLFGGFTASGNDMIVSYFMSKGISTFMSVVVSLTIFAIIDRVVTCVFCFSVLHALPSSFIIKNKLKLFKD